ncbi:MULTISPECIES: hypothetical protein [Alcanivorax]|uniref:hypothetical protein n=1 Tax=Alcanivorax TaxID=59753 RepID=UPI0025BD2549|nr:MULTISPECIES: hypothetical protein [Alcanivorax]MCK5886262.1 hypothetical protein [Alcanivorax sp.]
MSKILRLRKLRPTAALENLNRLTGLDFQSLPESLVNRDNAVTGEQDQVENRLDFPQRVSRQG